MAKRGRKTDAERSALIVLNGIPTEKPPAPTCLNAADQARWRALVSDLPGDRWQVSDLGLLQELIAAENLAAEALEMIEEHGAVIAGAKGTPIVSPWVTVHEKYVKQGLTLQRALRLPPSTRIAHNKMDLQSKPKGAAPWIAKDAAG